MKKMRAIEGEEATKYTRELLHDIKHELIEIAQDAFNLGDFEGSAANYHLANFLTDENKGITININDNEVSEDALKLYYGI